MSAASEHERHDRLLEIFSSVYLLEREERVTVLARECAGDPELRAQVERYLERHDEGGSFLEVPVLGEALRLDPDMLGPSADGRLAGQRIGHYHLRRVIASGGMGTVYEAEQEHPHRTVAVKVMKPGLTSPRALQRFEHEAQILAHLRHPAIAQVYDVGTIDGGADGGDGLPYFVMEYVPGAKPITSFAREASLSLAERLELFGQVCDAVHHGHQRGVIHRDLKPDNILVDESGDPKVIDFGVARVTDSDIAVTTLQTDIGQLIGTLQYMSPEQCAANPHDIDTRSDVYSLGLVLFELVCGELPYDLSRLAIHEAVQVIREAPAHRPRKKGSELHGDLDAIVSKALEKERERRYSSASDLGEDVRRYLRHEPVVARPPSAVYQLRMFARRNRALVGAAAAVFLALVFGLAGMAWQAAEAETARVTAERRRQEAEHEARVKTAVFEFLHEMLTGFEPGEKDMTVRVMLDRASAGIADAFYEDPLVEADVHDMLRAMYQQLGDYDHAEPHARRRVELLSQAHGGEDERTLGAEKQLAWILQNEGRAAEAESLHVRLFEVRRAALGEHHALTLVAQGDLGMNYWAQGRLEQAEQTLREVVEARRVHMVDDEVDLSTCLNNLGLILVGLERFEEAIDLLREAIALGPAAAGSEKVVLIRKWNLARALRKHGDVDGAFPLLTEVLAGRRALLGDDHPDTLVAFDDLTWVHEIRHEFGEATELYGEYLEAQRSRFGDVHPDIVLTLHHWGFCASEVGDLEFAEILARDALAMYADLPSPPPNEFRHATEVLYAILEARGRTAEERIAMLRETIEHQHDNAGPGHLELLVPLTLLGSELLKESEFHEAEGILRDADAIGERHWPEDYPAYWMALSTRSLLGEALLAQGQFEEAEPLLIEAYEHMLPPPDRGALKLEAGQRIVRLYQRWEHPAEVEKWRRKLTAPPASSDD